MKLRIKEARPEGFARLAMQMCTTVQKCYRHKKEHGLACTLCLAVR